MNENKDTDLEKIRVHRKDEHMQYSFMGQRHYDGYDFIVKRILSTCGSVCCLCLNNGQITVITIIAHTGHPDYIL